MPFVEGEGLHSETHTFSFRVYTASALTKYTLLLYVYNWDILRHDMQLRILGWHNQVSRVSATLPAPSSRPPAAEVYSLRVSTLFSLILCVISSHTLTLFNSFVILNNLKCCENIGALMFACKKKKIKVVKYDLC